jgi:magnesium transporter
MLRLKKLKLPSLKKKRNTGLPPGTVVFTGKQKVEKIDVHYLAYNTETLQEQVIDNKRTHNIYAPDPTLVQWYDVRGLHDAELIMEIGHVFGVHALVLEDIVDVNQRPKFEEVDKSLFVVIKDIKFNREAQKVITEQVAFYVGEGFLLSFQEDADDNFIAIRERLQLERGRIRQRGPDYLLFALLDLTVDNYFLGLDEIGEVIEEIEAGISNNFSPEQRSHIYDLKQELLIIRKAIAPLRELLGNLVNAENPLLDESTEAYFRDLRDHVFQVTDLVETYRENLNSLQDLFLSEMGHRTNTVMQILTVVSSIFIPLTFLAGIYGMNFEYIPELSHRNGYFVLLGVMVVLALSMVAVFKRMKWF